MFKTISKVFQMSAADNNHRQHRQMIFAPDRIGLVGFHDRAFVIARPTEAHASWLQQRSQEIHTKIGGQWTNITDGLRQGIELFADTPRGVFRRMWLLTDGYANVGAQSLMPVVRQARES